MSKGFARIIKGIETLCGNSGDGWYIIIQEAESEKFVQFAFEEGSGLIFDCPVVALDKEEVKKAEILLARYGIKAGDLTGGNFVSFNAELGNDINKAATIAAEMFESVYGISDQASFDIIINR
ncbi:MAG: hypothetical protein ACQETH_08870 [Candidatus Rifleibacteriota bacterium]